MKSKFTDVRKVKERNMDRNRLTSSRKYYPIYLAITYGLLSLSLNLFIYLFTYQSIYIFIDLSIY